MRWYEYIEYGFAGLVILGCLGMIVYLKLKPEPYENCAIRPREKRDWQTDLHQRRRAKSGKKGRRNDTNTLPRDKRQ